MTVVALTLLVSICVVYSLKEETYGRRSSKPTESKDNANLEEFSLKQVQGESVFGCLLFHATETQCSGACVQEKVQPTSLRCELLQVKGQFSTENVKLNGDYDGNRTTFMWKNLNRASPWKAVTIKTAPAYGGMKAGHLTQGNISNCKITEQQTRNNTDDVTRSLSSKSYKRCQTAVNTDNPCHRRTLFVVTRTFTLKIYNPKSKIFINEKIAFLMKPKVLVPDSHNCMLYWIEKTKVETVDLMKSRPIFERNFKVLRSGILCGMHLDVYTKTIIFVEQLQNDYSFKRLQLKTNTTSELKSVSNLHCETGMFGDQIRKEIFYTVKTSKDNLYSFSYVGKDGCTSKKLFERTRTGMRLKFSVVVDDTLYLGLADNERSFALDLTRRTTHRVEACPKIGKHRIVSYYFTIGKAVYTLCNFEFLTELEGKRISKETIKIPQPYIFLATG